jgi:hypothetical protein
VQDSWLLAPGCGRYLFAAGRQLPQLNKLVLGVPYNGHPSSHDNYDIDIYAQMVHSVPPSLGVGDVGRLVACCSALRSLWIAGLVQPGVDMSPLLHVTQLTQLCVGGS